MNDNLVRLIEKAERLMERIEAVLPKPLSEPDWSQSVAWSYMRYQSIPYMQYSLRFFHLHELEYRNYCQSDSAI